MGLEHDFMEIKAGEIVSYLLKETAQEIGEAVNPAAILELLGLRHLSIDFARELPIKATRYNGGQPRALLSFPERVIATDSSLSDTKARFSSMHEIAHYVLPQHVEEIVLCTERDMGFASHLIREIEANQFAADLLFHGDQFTIEANSIKLSAIKVKVLAEKYQASYEATARRLVEKSYQPCMLAVFERIVNNNRIDTSLPPRWKVRYSIPSAAFKYKYFGNIRSFTDTSAVTDASRLSDIAQSITGELIEDFPDGSRVVFQTEYFNNSYNVFCFLRPIQDI